MTPMNSDGGGTVRRKPTDILIERFQKSPGVESERLEFKARAKIDSNEGRRAVVQTLVGMANRWGGTVIIGVSEDDGTQVESFPEDSEAKRDLTNLIRDNTIPDLSPQTEITFDLVETDKHVLRIDVEQTNHDLYRFNTRDTDGYVPYYRVKDSTREMTSEDVIEFTESHRARSTPLGHTQTETIGSLRQSPSTTVAAPSVDARFVSDSDDDVQAVFGAPLLSRHKPLVFEVDLQVEVTSPEGVEKLVSRATDHLSVNPTSLVYSIHQGRRAWCGRGYTRLQSDVGEIDSVVTQMLDGHPRDVADEVTHLDDIRATLSIVADCYLGLFHAELYWKYGRFDKARAGVRLENIPFDDQFLHDFFGKYRSSPTVYDQRQNAKGHFVLLGDFELKNCIPVNFQREGQFTSYIAADNPFYGQRAAIQRHAEQPLPEPELERFCSLRRLLFHITDGTTSFDGRGFELETITVWPTEYLFTPFYIEAECSGFVT